MLTFMFFQCSTLSCAVKQAYLYRLNNTQKVLYFSNLSVMSKYVLRMLLIATNLHYSGYSIADVDLIINEALFQQGKLSSPNECMYICLPHQVYSFQICSKKHNLQWTINYNYIFEIVNKPN